MRVSQHLREGSRVCALGNAHDNRRTEVAFPQQQVPADSSAFSSGRKAGLRAPNSPLKEKAVVCCEGTRTGWTIEINDFRKLVSTKDKVQTHSLNLFLPLNIRKT